MSEGELRGNWEMQGNRRFNNSKGWSFEITEARAMGRSLRWGSCAALGVSLACLSFEASPVQH
jgi:hypothetical protein